MASLASTGSNCIVTSSIDKTVKVWDLDCMEQAVHTVERHDLPVEEVMLGGDNNMVAARSRNCIVVWDGDTGKMLRKVSNTMLGAVVTKAALARQGDLLVTVECNCLLIWNLDPDPKDRDRGLLFKEPVTEVVQLVLHQEDTRVLVVTKEALADGVHMLRVESRLLPDGESVYNLDFPVTRVKPICLTQDESWLVGLGWEAQRPVIFVFHTDSGEFLHRVLLKILSTKDVLDVVPVKDKHNTIAIIESDKANICDLKNKRFLKPIPCWTGQSSQNGKWGLSAPARGGLDLLDLGHEGALVHQLIPRRTQGVATVHAMFNATDEFVIYYNSVEASIQVFKVEGGHRLANYVVQADLRSIATSQVRPEFKNSLITTEL